MKPFTAPGFHAVKAFRLSPDGRHEPIKAYQPYRYAGRPDPDTFNWQEPEPGTVAVQTPTCLLRFISREQTKLEVKAALRRFPEPEMFESTGEPVSRPLWN